MERNLDAQAKKVSKEPLSEKDMALQDFLTTGLDRTKLASMIYGESKSKGEGYGLSWKMFCLQNLDME